VLVILFTIVHGFVPMRMRPIKVRRAPLFRSSVAAAEALLGIRIGDEVTRKHHGRRALANTEHMCLSHTDTLARPASCSSRTSCTM